MAAAFSLAQCVWHLIQLTSPANIKAQWKRFH
jgi:hypothetical protein